MGSKMTNVNIILFIIIHILHSTVLFFDIVLKLKIIRYNIIQVIPLSIYYIHFSRIGISKTNVSK